MKIPSASRRRSKKSGGGKFDARPPLSVSARLVLILWMGCLKRLGWEELSFMKSSGKLFSDGSYIVNYCGSLFQIRNSSLITRLVKRDTFDCSGGNLANFNHKEFCGKISLTYSQLNI